MTDDPIFALRSQLVDAAARRATASSMDARTIRRRLPRRALALIAALLVVPGSAAVAAQLLGGENAGSLPDGSVYTIADELERPTGSLSVDDLGRVCRVTRFKRDGRLTTTTRSCGPVNAPASDRALTVGYAAAPGNSTLASGTVSPDVAELEVIGAASAPTFSRQPGSDRRYFAVAFPADKPIVIVARNASGDEIDHFNGREAGTIANGQSEP